MPPTLEKKKSKAKRKGEPIPDKYSKIQKQRQQQTVIVNINKQKRGEKSAPRNTIEKPKEKEPPKTYNSFSFSMPQQQNPISDYLKVFQRDLYAKIEQAVKTKDPVINSRNEIVEPNIIRKPTVLETIPPPTTLDNFLKNQEELKKPLVIGEPVTLPDVTTLDEPRGISLDDVPEEKTKQTIKSLTTVEEPPDLTVTLSSPIKQDAEPTDLFEELAKDTPVSPTSLSALKGTPIPLPPLRRGRPPLSEEEKALRAENKPVITRPVGRPYGTTNESLRARLNNQLFEDTENPPKFASVKSLPRQQSSDLTIPSRIQRRKDESLFTGIDEPKPAPQRRASVSYGKRLGSAL
jgi:hypothetical protein